MTDPDRDERERLAALRAYGILDTPNEAEFDAIVAEAARDFRAPVALIALLDEHRNWFKARVGIDDVELPRSISFCTHAIRGPDVMVVDDMFADERFAANPMVTDEPNVRFYAGAPLKTPSGRRIGTLCVIDTNRHEPMSQRDKDKLAALAARTMAAFEARRRRTA